MAAVLSASSPHAGSHAGHGLGGFGGLAAAGLPSQVADEVRRALGPALLEQQSPTSTKDIDSGGADVARRRAELAEWASYGVQLRSWVDQQVEECLMQRLPGLVEECLAYRLPGHIEAQLGRTREAWDARFLATEAEARALKDAADHLGGALDERLRQQEQATAALGELLQSFQLSWETTRAELKTDTVDFASRLKDRLKDMPTKLDLDRISAEVAAFATRFDCDRRELLQRSEALREEVLDAFQQEALALESADSKLKSQLIVASGGSGGGRPTASPRAPPSLSSRGSSRSVLVDRAASGGAAATATLGGGAAIGCAGGGGGGPSDWGSPVLPR